MFNLPRMCFSCPKTDFSNAVIQFCKYYSANMLNSLDSFCSMQKPSCNYSWICHFPETEETHHPMHSDGLLSPGQITLISVIASITLLVTMATVAMRYCYHRRQHFKNLERRLLEVGEEVDENGEHYFVMRNSENGYSYEIQLLFLLTFKLWL